MTGPNRDPDQKEPGRHTDGSRPAPPGAQRPAERVMHGGGFSDRPVYREDGPSDRTGPNDVPDSRPFEHSDAALGGADAVQKTSYGSPLGAEPNGRAENTRVDARKGEGTVTARVGPGGGVGPVVWVTGALAVIAGILYAVGIFS